MNEVLALWRDQSPLMWCLHGLAIVTLAATLDRCLYWLAVKARRARGGAALIGIATTGGATAQTVTRIARRRDPLGIVARAAAEHPQSAAAPRQTAREQVRLMEQRLGLLHLAAVIGPLLGILGTMTGIAQAFGAGESASLPQPAAVGAGVALALRTTIWGLSISIFAACARFVFRGLAAGAIQDMQNFLEIIDHEHSAGAKVATVGAGSDASGD
jgi:biopolymer transport protein ExbB